MPATALAPACQIYLGFKALPLNCAERHLRDALAAGPVACALICDAALARFGDKLTGKLIALLHGGGVPVLVENSAELARSLGADGIHLDSRRMMQNAVLEVRALAGADMIIGAEAGLSRHAAMLNGEYGADYVSFGDPSNQRHHEIGQIADMVQWWAELFEISCVAWHRGGVQDAQMLVKAGADFLAVDDFVWSHPGGPAQAVAGLLPILKV